MAVNIILNSIIKIATSFLKGAVDKKLEKYADLGELKELEIDYENKKLMLDVKLKGELDTIRIELTGIKYENGNLKPNNVEIKREWMNNALKLWLSMQEDNPIKIEIPEKFRKYIEKIF